MESECYLLDGLFLIDSVMGSDNIYYAKALNNIAELYRETSRYELAENAYIESLKIREFLAGRRSLNYILGLNNLSLYYEVSKEYQKADSLLIEVSNIEINQMIRAGLFLNEQEYLKYSIIFQDKFNIILSILQSRYNNYIIDSSLASIAYNYVLNYKGLFLTDALRIRSLISRTCGLDTLFQNLENVNRQLYHLYTGSIVYNESYDMKLNNEAIALKNQIGE